MVKEKGNEFELWPGRFLEPEPDDALEKLWENSYPQGEARERKVDSVHVNHTLLPNGKGQVFQQLGTVILICGGKAEPLANFPDTKNGRLEAGAYMAGFLEGMRKGGEESP